jgi:hypothetical protein
LIARQFDDDRGRRFISASCYEYARVWRHQRTALCAVSFLNISFVTYPLTNRFKYSGTRVCHRVNLCVTARRPRVMKESWFVRSNTHTTARLRNLPPGIFIAVLQSHQNKNIDPQLRDKQNLSPWACTAPSTFSNCPGL